MILVGRVFELGLEVSDRTAPSSGPYEASIKRFTEDQSMSLIRGSGSQEARVVARVAVSGE